MPALCAHAPIEPGERSIGAIVIQQRQRWRGAHTDLWRPLNERPKSRRAIPSEGYLAKLIEPLALRQILLRVWLFQRRCDAADFKLHAPEHA